MFLRDPLGMELKVAVQVKLHQGTHADTHALEQLARTHLAPDGAV